MTTETNETPIPLTALTLRDHFAACALTGILAAPSGDPETDARCAAPKDDDELAEHSAYLAHESYALADAMLAERAKGGGK